jgi:hypothetical protein
MVQEHGLSPEQHGAIIKKRVMAETAKVKAELDVWIGQNTHPAQGVAVMYALLELGIEKMLDLHGDEDAREFVDAAFNRAVRRNGPPLQ